MNAYENYHKNQDIKLQGHDEGSDFVRIIRLMLPKWYFFVLSLILAYSLANFYIHHTLPVYFVSSTILVNQNQQNTQLNEQFLQGMGLPAGSQNIQNQIMILSSRNLKERALEILPFETDFYFRTLRNKLPIYPEIPITITLITGIDLPRNVEFTLSFVDSSRYHLETGKKARFELKLDASYGDTIDFPGGSLRIDNNDNGWLSDHKDRKLYFVFHDKMRLIKDYTKRLKVERIARDGTTLRVGLEGTNRAKDVDFINMITDLFISISLDKKNLEAARRIQFIDDQLVGISDSLMLTENRLQQFRSRNRVMDLSVQGQALISQSMELENQRARIKVETNYYDYLAEYLEKEISDEAPVAPATMGITDPGLMRLVAELAELQGQLSSRSFGEKNPLQTQLIQRIKNTKEALLETLNGLRRANFLAVEENQDQIRRLNNQAAALPGTERQLLGIERKFRLNDELYTFLLERRAEQQMQKASNVADNEVIDYAHDQDSIIVSPNQLAVFMLAWILGLFIPFALLYLRDSFNRNVKIEDIERINFFPTAGKIPHSSLKSNLVVFETPDSGIAEAFRIMRSKMQFFTKDSKSPVILLTSSLPEDGKSYIAINLASVFSLMGKKTVLVGFDLRKPRIFEDFNLDNDSGVSTWLIGKDKFQDIVKPTVFEDLYVIPAGPVPPNPSELTYLPKTEELINLLRKNYEIIIIDSSPIGLVSDTYHLASLADLCLLVIRAEKTLKYNLNRTINEMRTSDIKSISLVINDLTNGDKRYGYGGNYGYTSKSEPDFKTKLFQYVKLKKVNSKKLSSNKNNKT
jgi:capsular exopolysaccharide synthesis family protein